VVEDGMLPIPVMKNPGSMTAGALGIERKIERKGVSETMDYMTR
jgi:hypothetical protein